MVQGKLAEMAIMTKAARSLVYKAAWKLDNGEPEEILISMGKWLTGETGVRVVDESLQMHRGFTAIWMNMTSVVFIGMPK